jgi:hypothetical protein
MIRTFVAAVVLLSSARAFAGDIEHKSLTVEAANDDYTPTGINVSKGDVVLIGASGMIVTGPFAGTTDPNGHAGRCGNADTDGALMYKIGATAPQKAGKHKLVGVETEGELKFKVRDTKYNDNKGSFKVDAIRFASKIKPPSLIQTTVDVANDEWTASELTVSKGDVVLVFAKIDPANPVHFVNADARATGTPEGIRCEGVVKVESENDGALMMKVGTSEYRRAGALNFMVADTDGPVKFRARLVHPAGNKGVYKVGAYKFPANAIPSGATSLATNE